ncbi:hypothetical protein THITH_02155 [Thioalkalivibrio paradoxus ARh 1]|uniref:Uncharacterized protein n=1 Tax=Thioalkalivibrio paradoxus ARh 1 TaxID=713585 RepID=W0DSN5_9GAMM|nr:hypothetical protein THITH_02155 [Thioalkalivibrio paradoxus ARh 1]
MSPTYRVEVSHTTANNAWDGVTVAHDALAWVRIDTAATRASVRALQESA